jgi:hypothetical protein
MKAIKEFNEIFISHSTTSRGPQGATEQSLVRTICEPGRSSSPRSNQGSWASLGMVHIAPWRPGPVGARAQVHLPPPGQSGSEGEGGRMGELADYYSSDTIWGSGLSAKWIAEKEPCPICVKEKGGYERNWYRDCETLPEEEPSSFRCRAHWLAPRAVCEHGGTPLLRIRQETWSRTPERGSKEEKQFGALFLKET